MTYSDDSDLSRDEVRDLIGDTSNNTDTEYLSDKEIDRELARIGTIFLAAAQCAEKIAARYAISTDFNIGRKSKSKSQIYDHFVALAIRLRDRAQVAITAPSITQIKANVIRDSIPSNFPARQRISDVDVEPFGDYEE